MPICTVVRICRGSSCRTEVIWRTESEINEEWYEYYAVVPTDIANKINDTPVTCHTCGTINTIKTTSNRTFMYMENA